MLSSTEKTELFERLINIELKLNALSAGQIQSPVFQRYAGHLDQGLGHITFSQFGEDLIVANIFLLLDIHRPSYLDVGAHHPLDVSNTALLYSRGSRGINIEANPDLISAFQDLRPDDKTVNIGVGREPGRLSFYRIDSYSGRNTFDKAAAESFTREHPQFKITDVLQVDVTSLNEIVRLYADGVFPDFLSIDVEGLDFDVLDAADFSKSKPKVICVEAVSGADADDSTRLLRLLQERGYELHSRTIGNLILVERELAKCLKL